MSYDLMVFEPQKAPKSKKDFMLWYDKLTEWGEDVDYNEPEHTSESLKNWFFEMIKTFPAMNGSYAADDSEFDEDNSYVSDYSIASDAIYVAFAWSVAENAYAKTIELDKKHNVGFFDVSGDCEIFLPDGNEIE